MKRERVVAVVDDDDSLRAALGSLLKSYDVDVELFGSGESLLSHPALGEVGCLLTDVVMPGLDGFQLCRELRERGYQFPVIFMTAHQGDGDAERAAAVGAWHLLNKPFSTEEMMRCIAQALGRTI
ncbi:response regulator transcription factor [Roseateles depolymerans]|uniref:Transcriptional regulator n=1 Tax=Roseateles depolymerans TaxID=76731 RepID=A0A0U3MZU7_9BURK|nr:response regulator [Roseateles depolymerans]ALV08531.1 transcriptional regulator [Roseateles depolymerans]REG21243.1 response regulator receiver domain-containing protein [Roseateles depolymerans]